MSGGAHSSEAQRTVIDRYALYGEIAAGGAATVHFGRREGVAGFSRVVAIKRLHARNAKNPEFATMLLDEARLASRVRHPNVVSVEDVVAADGELLLVMEYIPGETLARLVAASKERGERVPVDIAVTILVHVLRGLAAAHDARGVDGQLIHLVHRDVSPQNVIVGQDGLSRIMDFGIAKALGRTQATTDEGRIKGKAAYMSPEQIMGDVDPRTDIWAASVMGWELLVNERLFATDSDVATLQEVLTKSIPSVATVRDDLPPSLALAIDKGLARSPLDRWTAAAEYAEALAVTVKLASVDAMTAWVERLAGPALRERESIVANVEHRAAVVAEAVPPSRHERASVRPRFASSRRIGAIAAVLGTVFGLALVVVAFRHRSSETATATSTSVVAVALSKEEEPPPTASVVAAPAPAARQKRVHLTNKPGAPSSKPAVCSYVDGEGIVKFRPCK
jgi:eukaryotic-like serine/threonine-protein kinase